MKNSNDLFSEINLRLEVKKLSESAKLPTKAHATDAGWDLYCDEDALIKVGQTAVLKTGVALGIPSGYYGKIEDRSSLASVGLRTGAGVVDSGYNGEIKIVIHNLNNGNDSTHVGQGYQIKKGQKIAQLVVNPVVATRLVEVEALEDSERGEKGFGSSGL